VIPRSPRAVSTGRWLSVAAIALQLLMIAVVIACAAKNVLLHPNIVAVAFGVGLALGLLGTIIAVPAWRAHRRRLQEHECRLCLHCHYVLPSEPTYGTCPESA
jgi:membrane protein YdbS with pleckstrin-like domain